MTEGVGASGKPERRTREQWAALVQECEASGESQRRFCAAHGIGQSSLRYWKRRLKQRCTAEDRSGARDTRLVPVKVLSDTSAPAGSGVAVVSARGIRVEIAQGFDAATLLRVLAALEAA